MNCNHQQTDIEMVDTTHEITYCTNCEMTLETRTILLNDEWIGLD